jgi:hypothetical protein
MAPPNSNPRPQWRLQATASVPYDWIQNHPSIAGPADGTQASSPPRLPPRLPGDYSLPAAAQNISSATVHDPLPSHYSARRNLLPGSTPFNNTFSASQQSFRNTYAQSHPPKHLPTLAAAPGLQQNYANQHVPNHIPDPSSAAKPRAKRIAKPLLQPPYSNTPFGYTGKLPILPHNGHLGPVSQPSFPPSQPQYSGQRQVEYEAREPGLPQDARSGAIPAQYSFPPSQSQALAQRQIDFEKSSKSQRDQMRHWYEEQRVRESDKADHWVAYKGQSDGQDLARSEAHIALERSQTEALAEAIKTKSQAARDVNSKLLPQQAIAEVNKFMEDEG